MKKLLTCTLVLILAFATTETGAQSLFKKQVKQLKKKYPTITANYIVCGWELNIAAKIRTHKVVRGDTLSKIAKKYNTTVNTIVENNKTKYNKITPNYIVCGWELIV